jgi:uncharacterized protein
VRALSQRIYDSNGWLYIPKNPISKAGIFPYLGSEIGAPEPARIYNVLRPPEELEKAAETFRLIPIIDEHELLGSIGTSTDERTPAGTTGETVTYEHPYLYSSIKITSDALQKQLARGKIELSPAYTCDWVEQSGEYEGEQYDYVQKINHGNHLALVEKGRTGRDVAVLDHYAFDTGGLVPMTLDELLAAIGALSDEDKAKLQAALSPATDEEKDETATDDEVTDIAEEADDVAEAAAEAVAAEEQGDDVTAVEAAGAAVENAEAVLEAAQELRDKIAEDSMKKAIRHIDARDRMLARVKPFIGAVPVIAQDSAESVAAYFLKKQGVKHAKGQATAVTMGYLHGRKPASETVAQDSAKPVTQDETINALWGNK